MANLEGAMEAIEDRLRELWTLTPIAFENDNGDALALYDTDGRPQPWVRCSISVASAGIRGVGKPGSHVTDDEGTIEMIVFADRNSGRKTARQHAVAVGEIFRTQSFFRVEPGCEVRTWTPRIDRGEIAVSENPDGVWWAVAVMVPFVFTRLA